MRHSQSAPVVMARLSKINGTPLSEIIKDADESKKWSYTREQRLTYGTEIDPDTFVSGTFPSKEATNELCLEVRYAERWGVEVGDTVTFDVLGIPLDFELPLCDAFNGKPLISTSFGCRRGIFENSTSISFDGGSID